MREDLTFTLTEETEKKLYEIMYSVDVKNTPRFWVKDKHGYSAFYEKVIHCKDCKHFELDRFDMLDGVPIITGHEICKKWAGGSKTSANGYCFMAERKETE